MTDLGVTRALAHWVATVPRDAVSERALRCARHALLDWIGVTLAARDEPLVGILLNDALNQGEEGTVPVVGTAARLSPAFAALVNGAASHALDFDDVNARVHGHPSVAIVPALLSAASPDQTNGEDFLDALIAGTEAACAVGEMLGPDHYAQGFHATATVGCLGAAAGVARLLGLDAEHTSMALGLAATQAAGLKASFGTMAKPLHAGRAAMSGLLAARWAASGLEGSGEAIEADQGLGRAMSPGFTPTFAPPVDRFGIEANCYKYYPACYYTHSAIAATRDLMQQHGIAADDVRAATIELQPQHDKVCNIADPRDGLGIKFSVRHLVAMTLADIDVGDPTVYTRENAQRPDLADLRGRIVFEGAALPSRTAARVHLVLGDGRMHGSEMDVGIPAEDLDLQEAHLRSKFDALSMPVVGSERSDRLAQQFLKLGADSGMANLTEELRSEGTP